MTLARRILIGSIGTVLAGSAPPVVAHDWFEFNGHRYALTDVGESWQEAEDEAVALGGHLVAIRDQDENDFLVGLLREVRWEENVWIGLYQIPGSGEPGEGWVWSNEEPVEYTNWIRGEPNNNGNEDWAEMKGLKSPWPGQWNDLGPLIMHRGIIEVNRRGDVNCDGVVNAFDIEPFLTALFEPSACDPDPNCCLESADMNCDGHVDAFDIEPFLDCLFGGNCDCP